MMIEGTLIKRVGYLTEVHRSLAGLRGCALRSFHHFALGAHPACLFNSIFSSVRHLHFLFSSP